jgi:uncharacterized protein YodC (DUF2158 family)
MGKRMAETIEPGSKVVLKSGGPLVTVKWVNEDQAYCEWFDGKKLLADQFAITSLDIGDNDLIV